MRRPPWVTGRSATRTRPDHTASGSDRASVKRPWPALPAPRPAVLWWCVCVPREGDATPCSSRDAADSSRAVPTSAHDTPLGTSLWATVTHWLQTQLASESTARHQGGLQGEIQPEPGFGTWRAAD